MSDETPNILRGNFKPKKAVRPEKKSAEDELEEKFEREAMKRLGGSIAFVSKKKVKWDLDD
jgi:hypothetical protein